MAPKFTRTVEEALQRAQAEAIRRDHQELHPEHLIFVLLSGEGGEFVPDLLQLAGVNLPALRVRLEETLGRLPKVSGGGQVYASPSLNKLLVLSEDEAKKLGDEYVSGEHLFLALFLPRLKDLELAKSLRSSGLTYESLVDALKKARGGAKIQDS